MPIGGLIRAAHRFLWPTKAIHERARYIAWPHSTERESDSSEKPRGGGRKIKKADEQRNQTGIVCLASPTSCVTTLEAFNDALARLGRADAVRASANGRGNVAGAPK